MDTNIGADEARAALSQVQRRQEGLVGAVLVPAWYWWAVGAFTVALGAAVDSGRPPLIGGVAVGFGIVVGGATAWVIAGRGRAQVSKDLLGDRGVLAILGFIGATVGLGLGTAFGLRAGGVSHPALLACVACALGLLVGGPTLMTYLRRSMTKRMVAPR